MQMELTNNPTAAVEPSQDGPLSGKMDRLGIAASLACAIHCLIAPFLLLVLPVAGTAWSHPVVHWVLAALVIPLAIFVIFRGARQHKRYIAMVFAVLGAGFILAGLVIPHLPADSSSTASGDSATTELTAAPVASVVLVLNDESDESDESANTTSPSTNAHTHVHTDTCCPTINIDPETGEKQFNLPAASIVTIIGSVLLILAHGTNLYACHCFSRDAAAAHDSDCGCPSMKA